MARVSVAVDGNGLEVISFTIPVAPRTKKNSGIIAQGNRPFLLPSKQYRAFEADCAPFVPQLHISEPVNIKSVFYMDTRRKVDLSNLISGLHDTLVHYQCVEDDNCNIIFSTDGSYVGYDHDNPRIEITITKVHGITTLKDCKTTKKAKKTN